MASNDLVIEEIEAHNLGRRSATEHVTSQNPFLRFEIGSEVHKSSTKKGVSSHVVYEDEMIRFSKFNEQDTLKVGDRIPLHS